MDQQRDLQTQWHTLFEKKGLRSALQALYDWSVRAQYIQPDRLAENINYHWWSAPEQLSFRIQINVVRSRYVPPAPKRQGIASPLDFSWVASSDKPLLRVFECSLRGRLVFFQLTPFPLAPRHFVCIERQVTPMRMDGDSVEDLVALVQQLPGYTFLSNSDVAWAGASVLQHHHYQMIDSFKLPIMHASWDETRHRVVTNTFGSGQVGFLRYPAATVKLCSPHTKWLTEMGGRVIANWRQQQPENTCNLVLRKVKGQFELYVILRHPHYRTDETLRKIKAEGVGVVEMAGEGIFPLPEGEDASRIWAELYRDGGDIVKHLIMSNSPSPYGAGFTLSDLLGLAPDI